MFFRRLLSFLFPFWASGMRNPTAKLARPVLQICSSPVACLAAAIDPAAYLAGRHDRLLAFDYARRLYWMWRQFKSLYGWVTLSFEQWYLADVKASWIFGWDNMTDWQLVSSATRWPRAHQSPTTNWRLQKWCDVAASTKVLICISNELTPQLLRNNSLSTSPTNRALVRFCV